MLVNILNKLFEYSNHYIQVRNERTLQMPGFSMIEKDIHGQYIPVILINLDLIPNNESVLAHVLSHEWGHQVLKHIELVPPHISQMPNQQQRQEKENEADKFAASFIKEYGYSKNDIEHFMRQNPHDLENRLNILNSI